MELLKVRNFGAIDADSDDLLRDCFQDHPAYIAVRDFERFLVLGRKGSGKTAIFKRFITDRTANVFGYGYTFNDYPWHHHNLQAQIGVPEERRYIHSWKYLILMSLAKVLLNFDDTQPWDEDMDSLTAIESFVIDSYGSRDPDLSQLFTPEKELKLKATLGVPGANITGERLSVRELPLHIQEVNRAIERHVMRSLHGGSRYYICFDQLDLGFSLSHAEYRDQLVGLLNAARDLFVAARDAMKRLNVVVFLRDDIYQELQFEDKNKITENYAVRLRWEEAQGSLTLKRLMESRFTELLGGRQRSVAWDEVFDENKEMPSRQTKYAHICDRTFLRPRDMIKFCNVVLERFQNAGGNEVGRLDNDSIHTARGDYSEYLLNELDDEIAKHVPNYKDYLEVVKVLGKEKFSLSEFVDAWSKTPTLASGDAAAALEQLFEFSVVGYLKLGGRGGGSEYVWRYLDSRARFSREADTYRVHQGFKEALALTRVS